MFVKIIHSRSIRRLVYVGLNALACLVLGALLLGQPASAFLWATNTVSISGDSVILSAGLKLELSEATEKQVFNFKNTREVIDVQKELQNEIKIFNLQEKQDTLDEYFAEWCLDNLLADENSIFTGAGTASWCSMIERSYTFRNVSDIPVYFRINRAAVTNSMDITLATFWNRGKGTPYQKFDYDFNSGFYYHRTPLFVGQDITITFVAMILDTGGISGNFDFRPDFAEIIQATNNAVFLAEGWKNFAGELVPYTHNDDSNDGLLIMVENAEPEKIIVIEDNFELEDDMDLIADNWEEVILEEVILEEIIPEDILTEEIIIIEDSMTLMLESANTIPEKVIIIE